MGDGDALVSMESLIWSANAGRLFHWQLRFTADLFAVNVAAVILIKMSSNGYFILNSQIGTLPDFARKLQRQVRCLFFINSNTLRLSLGQVCSTLACCLRENRQRKKHEYKSNSDID